MKILTATFSMLYLLLGPSTGYLAFTLRSSNHAGRCSAAATRGDSQAPDRRFRLETTARHINDNRDRALRPVVRARASQS
jgi:hypothetical protein